MCNICLHTPCLDKCPNADQERTFGVCDNCGEPIVFGSMYAVIDGDNNTFCHNDCLAAYYGSCYIDWDAEEQENNEEV